jgi:hypothetical protein
METTSGDLRIRISKRQKEMLKNIAESKGFSTLSSYVRAQIFDDLSLHSKINKIINLLSDKREQRGEKK